MQNSYFGSKIKILKNMSKSILQIIYSCSVKKKKRSKKTTNIREMRHFQNGQSSKGYSPCKILNLGQKLKFQKNMSKSILQILYSASLQKNRSKKHQIFKKLNHFENRSSCKGYSPCKILILGQILKFHKTCENPFYKSFTIVLCKNPSQKTSNIREMRDFENGPLCKGYSPCKILTLGQKLKF